METKCAVQDGWLPEVYADSKPALVAYTGGPFRCVMNTSLRAFQEEAYCKHICATEPASHFRDAMSSPQPDCPQILKLHLHPLSAE